MSVVGETAFKLLMMLSLCFNQNNQSWNDLGYDGQLLSGNKQIENSEMTLTEEIKTIFAAETGETSKLLRKLLMIIQLITNYFLASFIPGIIS